jgi:hypothetical protein
MGIRVMGDIGGALFDAIVPGAAVVDPGVMIFVSITSAIYLWAGPCLFGHRSDAILLGMRVHLAARLARTAFTGPAAA